MNGDVRFMARALRLAGRGVGRVSPNPLVGAVIVRDGRVIAEGWHHACGADHAEVDALKRAGADAAGADVYVNLEPCCHHGRTPPCAQALIDAGVRRVVVAMIDPNPLVSGRGVAMLRDAGIAVDVGVGEAAARALNAPFAKWIVHGRPHVTLKMAATMDGRTADRDGHARWISSPASRRAVHRMRAAADAVLVGEGTLRADDPMLLPVGVRAGRPPLRVVAAASGRLPADARLFASLDRGPVAVALPEGDDTSESAALAARGVALLRLPAASGGVDPAALVDALGRRGVTSVLCEGGAGLGAALLRAGRVDRVVLFLAPRLLGDPAAHPLVGDLGRVRLDDALGFRVVRVGRSGPDVRVDLEPA